MSYNVARASNSLLKLGAGAQADCFALLNSGVEVGRNTYSERTWSSFCEDSLARDGVFEGLGFGLLCPEKRK